MARRVVDPTAFLTTSVQTAADASLDAFVGTGKPRKKRARTGRADVRRTVEEVRRLVQGGEPKMMTPTQLVALYYLCHSEVYGAEPSELVGETWRAACLAAGRLSKSEFNGNSADVVEFIRWVWRREKWREDRRQDGASRWRVTWRQQFVRRDLLADYRTDLARRARRKK